VWPWEVQASSARRVQTALGPHIAIMDAALMNPSSRDEGRKLGSLEEPIVVELRGGEIRLRAGY
jgi:hypothetical protein